MSSMTQAETLPVLGSTVMLSTSCLAQLVQQHRVQAHIGRLRQGPPQVGHGALRGSPSCRPRRGRPQLRYDLDRPSRFAHQQMRAHGVGIRTLGGQQPRRLCVPGANTPIPASRSAAAAASARSAPARTAACRSAAPSPKIATALASHRKAGQAVCQVQHETQ